MNTEFDILGIGNVLMDIIAPVPDSFLARHNIEKGSMTLIDEAQALALNTALKSVGNLQEIAGGSAANTMFGIGALGLRAAYLGNVANDDVGKRLSTGMNKGSVDFSSKPKTNGPASGRCLIAVTPDGERSMSTFLGASCLFTPKDIVKPKIESAACVYLEGYLFDAKPAKPAFVKVAEIARAAGRQVALTLSDSFCVDRHRASFRQLVDNHVDILFANTGEILSLYETDSLDKALDGLTKTKTVACITRSEKGSVIQDTKRRYHIKACPLDKIVDTTGAGDQYAAGVLAGRAMGLDWADAGHLGSLAAAEVISHYGARPEKSLHDIALGL
jgi:sugar/nucleoside kinase (ribokinase family)